MMILTVCGGDRSIHLVELMGEKSFHTGVLPTYATIGIWAPLLLTLLRLLQGIVGRWGVTRIIII